MIENLFPTPIYYDFVSDNEAIKYHIDKIIDKVDFNMMKEWGDTHYISTDFRSNPNVLKEYGLVKLSKEIDKHLGNYCSALNLEKRKYSMISWFTKFKKGNYGHVHHHSDTDLSGVYYYKTNGDDGDLFFQPPNPHLDTSKCYKNISDSWVHKPMEGKIIIFPGWIRHGIKTNSTDNIRMSLSFNIKFEDKGYY